MGRLGEEALDTLGLHVWRLDSDLARMHRLG